MILLLNRSELGIALNANHTDDSIPDGLLWDLHPPFPLWSAFEITELNAVSSGVPVELDVEAVVT